MTNDMGCQQNLSRMTIQGEQLETLCNDGEDVLSRSVSNSKSFAIFQDRSFIGTTRAGRRDSA